MGKALYRKYRSKSLSEVVGQEHITSTLENALKNNAISHAYLFTGPHGVGKTSIARILAHEVNDFAYDESATQVDIIEIDAASNRRIDEIRELRDRVNIAPVSGKYKVYIIDEVHMLTREAFNALLKTLEEPPAHVIFILATTEAHKLPETIISRTQRHSFKPIPKAAIKRHLRSIADDENITISDAALDVIAAHGQGSFRDSISLLDQLSQQKGEVSQEVVEALLGVPPKQLVDDIHAAIKDGPNAIFQIMETIGERGYEPSKIAQLLAADLRQKLTTAEAISTEQCLQYLASLYELPAQPDQSVALELLLLNMHYRPISGQNDAPTSTMPQAVQPAPAVAKKIEPAPSKPTATLSAATDTSSGTTTKPAEAVTEKSETPTADFDWEACLGVIRQQYNTLYGVLRMAEAELKEDTLLLGFKFGFHQKKINDTKHRQLIADVISKQCGRSVIVETEVRTDAAPKVVTPVPTQTEEPKTPADLATISNIFGGAEVLE